MFNYLTPRKQYPVTPEDYGVIKSAIHEFALECLQHLSFIGMPSDSWAKLQSLQEQANIEPRKVPPDYREYLNSRDWKRVRLEIIAFYGGKCAVCFNDKNLHVHHRDYANWKEETYEDCLPLCFQCHAVVHINGFLPLEWFYENYNWLQMLLCNKLCELRRMGMPLKATEICDEAYRLANLAERHF